MLVFRRALGLAAVRGGALRRRFREPARGERVVVADERAGLVADDAVRGGHVLDEAEDRRFEMGRRVGDVGHGDRRRVRAVGVLVGELGADDEGLDLVAVVGAGLGAEGGRRGVEAPALHNRRHVRVGPAPSSASPSSSSLRSCFFFEKHETLRSSRMLVWTLCTGGGSGGGGAGSASWPRRPMRLARARASRRGAASESTRATTSAPRTTRSTRARAAPPSRARRPR